MQASSRNQSSEAPLYDSADIRRFVMVGEGRPSTNSWPEKPKKRHESRGWHASACHDGEGHGRARLFLALLMLGLAILGGPVATRADPAKIMIFTAASLKNALDDAAKAFGAAHSVEIAISYAGTSNLAKQIEAGAPADLFIAADEAWMDHVEKAGLLRAGSRRDLIGNRLVLIAPRAAIDRFENWPQWAARIGDRKLAMADWVGVPAGKYGRAALEHLGLWAEVESHIVQGADVRAALAFVARREAAFGIVYASDAFVEARVRILAEFPADSYPAIRYAAAQLSGSDNRAAGDFLAFLSSPEGAAIFRAYGFQPLSAP